MSGKRYDHRVAFDRPAKVADGYGGSEEGWLLVLECAADIMFLRGGETVQASRLEGRQPAVVTVRQNSLARNVATDWRMRDLRNGDVYEIKAAVPTDDRLDMEITCVRGKRQPVVVAAQGQAVPPSSGEEVENPPDILDAIAAMDGSIN